MKYWLAAAAVVVSLAAAIWFLSPSKPVAAGQAPAVDDQVYPRASRRATPALKPVDAPSEWESPDADPVSPVETAPAPLKPVALASLAELPVGPEPAPGLTPSTVMENVRATLRNYSSRFGGNPVGTNQEITRMLNGANPGQTPFLQGENGLAVNDQGELVDNWGTPFFFHQLSRTEMEIHSAGPDRRMWTADDLVLK